MGSVAAENVTDFIRQKVEVMSKETTLFELEAPTYKAISPAVRTEPITQKGYRLPHYDRMPGGIGGYLPGDSSFNEHVAPSSRSMYVFPTYMAQPIIFDGATIRMLESGSESKAQTLGDVIDFYYRSFTKGIEYMCHGDGSGTLAVSSGSVSTLGTGQTLSGTTAAAATPGQTKGTVRLRKGHFYDAVNPSTGAVRGQFYVETEGKSSCTIFLLNGSISSGDLITWPNSYNRVPRGLGHLISAASRILQTLNTASDPNLNAKQIDLNGTLCTPTAFDQAKTALLMENNDPMAENGLLCFATYNFMAIVRRQNYALTIQDTDEARGHARRYTDGDTMWVLSKDADEDRAYLTPSKNLVNFEEMALKEFDMDGQTWRMLLGNNGTGSDAYQKAFGIAYNWGILRPIQSAFIKRALVTSTQREVDL